MMELGREALKVGIRTNTRSICPLYFESSSNCFLTDQTIEKRLLECEPVFERARNRVCFLTDQTKKASVDEKAETFFYFGETLID